MQTGMEIQSNRELLAKWKPLLHNYLVEFDKAGKAIN